MAAQQLLSIVIPCYNEAENIRPIFAAFQKALIDTPYKYELVFVDDGSTDTTIERIRALKSSAKFKVVALELARNFGKEIATTAGLHSANGEAAILIDADLQHPPALIPKLIEQWVAGADIVVGVRDKNNKRYANLIKKSGSAVFYRIMQKITEVDIVPDATDFRLLDRVVINEFNRFTERSRMTRGLIDWLGFKRAYVHFTPDKRVHGEAAYSLRRLFTLAMHSFVTMSLVPLKVAGYLGSIITVLAGLLGAGIVVEKYILNDPWGLHITSTAGLGTLTLFLIGIVLASLGLIALYVASIHTEVMNRPLYVVRQPRGSKAAAEPLLNVTKEMVEEHDAA